MESNNTITYDVDKSVKRLDDILNAGNGNYSDKDTVPVRSSLTYTNGYYVNVTSVFVDIVGSSDMTDQHQRPVLAKMYRGFVSECVAIMNSYMISREINIHGDCVWGIFETPLKSDIDTVIDLMAKISSLVKILNYKLSKKGYSTISVGIAADYGRALMIQAGYSGSGINDVIWMGDVVNSASKLCGIANRGGRKGIVVSCVIYNNIKDKYKGYLSKFYDGVKAYYEGNLNNNIMEAWYDINCK